MPHADPEARRAYMREYKRKRRQTEVGKAEHRAEQAAAYVRRGADLRARVRAYRAANPEKCKAADKVKLQRTLSDSVKTAELRERSRENMYRRNFGIGVADVRRMYDEQAGRCAVCARELTEHSGRSKTGLGHVDHCHKTGVVRKLLCMRCNMAVGKLEMWHDTGLLVKLQAYVSGSK